MDRGSGGRRRIVLECGTGAVELPDVDEYRDLLLLPYLQLRGYRVLIVTDRRLVRSPDEVVADLGELLEIGVVVRT